MTNYPPGAGYQMLLESGPLFTWITNHYPLALGLICFCSYLAGSIPTAFIVARRNNVDIRAHGSGNVGATNTLRVLGKKAGLLVLAVDMAKGFFPVYLTTVLFISVISGKFESAPVLAGTFAILGHIFPVWLNFKGGKGVATLGGVLLALAPLQFIIATAIFFLTVYLTQVVSLGSILAVGSLPFAYFLNHTLGMNFPLFVFLCTLALLVIFMHRENIRRLQAGKESRAVLEK